MAKKYGVLKDIGMIIAGGFVEIATQVAMDNLIGKTILFKTYDTGDLSGALVASAITAFGYVKGSTPAILVGGGGLAVSAPNFVGKLIF